MDLYSVGPGDRLPDEGNVIIKIPSRRDPLHDEVIKATDLCLRIVL